MKRVFSIIFLLLVSASLYSATYTATQTGSWNAGTTWGGTCTTGCIAGTDYPGSTDDAIIPNGISVTLLGTFQVRNLLLDYLTPNSINLPHPVASILTINGTLASYYDVLGFVWPAEVDIVGGTGILKFTGSNIGGITGVSEIIAYMNNSVGLYNVDFSLSGTATIDQLYNSVFSPENLKIANVTVSSGTLSFGTLAVGGLDVSNALTVNSGATLNINTPATSFGLSNSSIPTVSINGTVNLLDVDSYLNSSTLNIGSTGVLNVAFSGANQTQGWWYQSNSPNLTADASSTVSFNSTNAAQNISALQYGNLSISSGGSSLTKTLSTSGSLIVLGKLSVGAATTFATSGNPNAITLNGNVINDGVWNPSQAVNFRGTAQTTSGNSIAFGGEVDLSSSVTFNNSVTFSTSLNTNNNNVTFGGATTTFNGTVAGLNTVVFNKNTNQTIAGTSALSIPNLTINTVGTLSNTTSGINLSGILSVGSGSVLSTGGASKFTFLSSSASNSAQFQGSGTISGNVTWQRNFSSTAERWRNLSLPISSNTSDFAASGYTYIYGTEIARFDETQKSGAYSGWVYDGYPYANFGLSAGTGYSFYTYSQDLIDNGQMVSFTGSVFQAPAKNFPLRHTSDIGDATLDGWNFIGNPYLSSINWNKSVGAVQVWNGSSYVAIGNGAPNGNTLAPGQSFWVYTATDNNSVSISATDKITTQGTMLRTEETYENRLVFTLTDVDGNWDNGLVWFQPNSTPEFDQAYDALKRPNTIHNISTFGAGDIDLNMNSYGELPLGMETIIRMNLTNANPGVYTMDFSDLESFTTAPGIILYDKYEGLQIDIIESPTYIFIVNSEAASSGSERFELIFNVGGKITAVEEFVVNNEISVYPNPVQDELTISTGNQEGKIEVVVWNQMGQVVIQKTGDLFNGEIKLNMQNLNKGIYFLNITDQNGTLQHRIVKD